MKRYTALKIGLYLKPCFWRMFCESVGYVLIYLFNLLIIMMYSCFPVSVRLNMENIDPRK